MKTYSYSMISLLYFNPNRIVLNIVFLYNMKIQEKSTQVFVQIFHNGKSVIISLQHPINLKNKSMDLLHFVFLNFFSFQSQKI
jgi:hypothetical protein